MPYTLHGGVGVQICMDCQGTGWSPAIAPSLAGEDPADPRPGLSDDFPPPERMTARDAFACEAMRIVAPPKFYAGETARFNDLVRYRQAVFELADFMMKGRK